MNAVETLISILCDPEGKCCISGSDDDRRLIDSALADLAQPAPHLPERDAILPAERQGLFRKFVVGRVDGSDKPGGKHHGCTYFVLDVDHDPCARPALAAYAAACESTHPTLAADLRTKWGVVPAPQPAPAPLSDDVVKDAARWRMAALIGNEVMLHPDKRTHATAVKAYMDATHSGSDLTGAVDAALAAQGGGK